MVNVLHTKFKTADEAEDAYGISVNSYLASFSDKESVPATDKGNELPLSCIPEKAMDTVKKLTGNQRSMLVYHQH